MTCSNCVNTNEFKRIKELDVYTKIFIIKTYKCCACGQLILKKIKGENNGNK